jgi:hypothetical protein
MWRYEWMRVSVEDDRLAAALNALGAEGWDARSLRLDADRGVWDVLLRRVETDRDRLHRAFSLKSPTSVAWG